MQHTLKDSIGNNHNLRLARAHIYAHTSTSNTEMCTQHTHTPSHKSNMERCMLHTHTHTNNIEIYTQHNTHMHTHKITQRRAHNTHVHTQHTYTNTTHTHAHTHASYSYWCNNPNIILPRKVTKTCSTQEKVKSNKQRAEESRGGGCLCLQLPNDFPQMPDP